MKKECAKQRSPHKRNKTRSRMLLTFTAFVFFIMVATTALVVCVFAALFASGLLSFRPGLSPLIVLIILFLPSVVISTVATALLSRHPLKPLSKLLGAITAIADGDFTVRLDEQQHHLGFADVAKAFNKMAEELQNIETLRSDFISSFSHEFKTPIVSLKGFAKLLKKGGLTPEEEGEYIDIIIAESERLTRLAENTLTLSKLENQSIVVDKKEFALDEQLRQCILLTATSWEKKNIRMTVDLPAVTYYGSEALLQQVWLNILSNAVRFTPEGGEIAVALKEGTETLAVSVTDSGAGMDEETAKRVFDKFYQGDASRTGDGNGLGLAIAARIVRIAEGSIQLKTAPNAGSTFTVLLPLVNF